MGVEAGLVEGGTMVLFLPQRLSDVINCNIMSVAQVSLG